jgi:hypothetical protein
VCQASTHIAQRHSQLWAEAEDEDIQRNQDATAANASSCSEHQAYNRQHEAYHICTTEWEQVLVPAVVRVSAWLFLLRLLLRIAAGYCVVQLLLVPQQPEAVCLALSLVSSMALCGRERESSAQQQQAQ